VKFLIKPKPPKNFWISRLNLGYFVRSFTILTGGTSTILLAHQIISTYGNNIYALFIVMTSLPSLMPFLDFGLGSSIFNFYTDRRIDRVSSAEEVDLVSVVFCLILGVGIFLFSALFFAIVVAGINLLGISYWDGNLDLFLLLILGATIVAAPFSIGSKKLHAQSQSHKVWLAEGSIPILTYFLILICMQIAGKFEPLMLVVPSMIHLISAVCIFYLSGLHRIIRIPKFAHLKTLGADTIKLGFWSLVLTTSVSLIWHIPKYLYSFSGNFNSVAEYGILAMVLIPAFSLLNVSSTLLAPFARLSKRIELHEFLIDNLRKTFFRSILISSLVTIGICVLHFLDLPAPNFLNSLILILILMATPFWIIPFTAFSNHNDLRWLSVRVVPVLIVGSLGLFLCRSLAFSQSIFLYFLSIFFFFSILAWPHISRDRL